jgi:hypothetical protein
VGQTLLGYVNNTKTTMTYVHYIADPNATYTIYVGAIIGYPRLVTKINNDTIYPNSSDYNTWDSLRIYTDDIGNGNISV